MRVVEDSQSPGLISDFLQCHPQPTSLPAKDKTTKETENKAGQHYCCFQMGYLAVLLLVIISVIAT